jgi:hypothetical protein
VTSLTFPPIFGAGGGGASGAAFPRNLTFGGAKPALRTIRWRPHELVRSGEVLVDGVTIDVTSTVRVGFNATQVLARLPRLCEFTLSRVYDEQVRLDFTNPTDAPVDVSIEAELVAEVQWFKAASFWGGKQ